MLDEDIANTEIPVWALKTHTVVKMMADRVNEQWSELNQAENKLVDHDQRLLRAEIDIGSLKEHKIECLREAKEGSQEAINTEKRLSAVEIQLANQLNFQGKLSQTVWGLAVTLFVGVCGVLFNLFVEFSKSSSNNQSGNKSHVAK